MISMKYYISIPIIIKQINEEFFLPQFISKEIHDIVVDGYEEH